MTPRVGVTRFACIVVAATAVVALASEAVAARSLGSDAAVAVWIVIAYAAYATTGVGLSGSFTPTQKTALIAACTAIASLLPLAVTGRLGVLSLPLIFLGPSLPFMAAARLPRPHEGADDADPSPTLAALLRGKRLRAAEAGSFRKPAARQEELLF